MTRVTSASINLPRRKLDSVNDEGALQEVSSAFLQQTEGAGGSVLIAIDGKVMVQRTGEFRRQTVYGVTSLTAAEAAPERLLTLMRDYWGIENGLHYRRDQTIGEDAARLSNPKEARVTAILNNLVGALVK